MNDNTQRFSDRVDNYTKYRPSYPRELINYLREHFQVSNNTVIADIGSGTGKLTELLLPISKNVIGVEPNNEMRLEAEKRLKEFRNFESINGTSENTTLLPKSIDLITVAQAFHWFDQDKTKIEFNRILKENSYVLIISNKRVFTTPFLKEYEEILKENIKEYSEVNHYRITEKEVQKFFTSNYKNKIFSNIQTFDWNGLIGRLCSSSYTPKNNTKEYEELEGRIKKIFNKYSENGFIDFLYESSIQSGKIN